MCVYSPLRLKDSLCPYSRLLTHTVRDKAFTRTGRDGRNPALALAAIFCKEIVLFFLSDLNVLFLHAPVSCRLLSNITTWLHTIVAVVLRTPYNKKMTSKHPAASWVSKASLVRERDCVNTHFLRWLRHANNRSIKQLRRQSIIKSSGRTPESVPVCFISCCVNQPERLPLRSELLWELVVLKSCDWLCGILLDNPSANR